MLNKKVITAGLICLDVTPDLSMVPENQFAQLFQPGQLIRTGGIRCTPGGAVANTGLALHRLGVPVRLIGKIGNDLFGQALQDRLRAETPHLAEDLVIDLTLPTSLTIVINPPGSDRAFLHQPGANDTFYASDLPRQILEDADLFHFGYPPMMRSIYRGEGAELVSILLRARRAGLSTSLDFTLPDSTSPAAQLDWPIILANTLPLVDLFVPSIEELVFLLQREMYDEICTQAHTAFIDAIGPELLEALAEKVLSYGVKALLVKLGHRGVYLRTAAAESWEKCGRGLEDLDARWHNRQLWTPAFAAHAKVRTGSGDSAIAGFLASLLRGTDPETALKMAAAAGAICIESSDPFEGLEGWDQTWARVQQGWETLPLALDAFGWVMDQKRNLWEK